MKNLFNQKGDRYSNYVIFQDEAGCGKTDFYYHGFLFVRNESNIGTEILNNLIEIKQEENRRMRDISFKEIDNKAADNPQGRKTNIVLKWMDISRQAFFNNHIKFYCFGVNKSNLSNFWSDYDKGVYLKSFEIGLKSAIGWFGAEKNIGPINITHFIYEKGPHNIDREDKVKWMNYEFAQDEFQNNKLPNQNKVLGLFSDEKHSNKRISNFLQLTDILLGICKYSFIKNPGEGREQCIDRSFGGVVKDFTYNEKIYHTNHNYYKKLGIGFFPKNSGLTEDEFLQQDLEYFKKSRDSFYNFRKTGDVKLGEEKQIKLNI